MRATVRWSELAVMAAICLLGVATPSTRADDAAGAVVVQFSTGTTRPNVLQVDSKLFINRSYTITNLPDELAGLQYARRSGGVTATCTIDAPAGATVYVLSNDSDAMTSVMEKAGWTKLQQTAAYKTRGDQRVQMTVMKKTFDTAEHCELSVVSSGNCFVASSNLKALPSATPAAGETAEPETAGKTPETAAGDTEGPATQPALRQATIHALEIYKTDSGMMLGQTSEATLTITPSKSPKSLAMKFVTKTGPQMELAKDEAIRFLRLKYPNWYAQTAELTFEDKYVNHDGGSIGTALGVLMLSTIEGFAIDPNIAITGDISANGKVRAIGGVAAKIKGAIASKCTTVAIPADNYDQLVDGVIYNGSSLVSDIQVMGISTLAEAVDAVRTDRQAAINEANESFAVVQAKIKKVPGYLKTKEARDRLNAIQAAVPQNYSAKLLLIVSNNKLPKTLSATATSYYASLAALPVMDVFQNRAKGKTVTAVPSTAVKAGLADLRKLRPMANEAVRPLVDAWSKFIDAIAALQERGGSQQAVERQRQVLLDELARERADSDMMQKMLKEGM